MKIRQKRPSFAVLLSTVAALTLSTAARAGDFYATGDIAISGLQGDVEGSPTFAGDFSDSGSDTSPAFGLALGYAVPLDYLIPWNPNLPKWVPFDIEMPHWDLRTDVEILGGEDHELSTDGSPDTYQTQVETWSLMWNFYLDVPLRTPARKLFGRVALLERASLDIGVGVGVGSSKAQTDNGIETGKDQKYGIAYQAAVSAGYRVSPTVKLSFGYRFRDNPDLKLTTRSFPGATSSGNLKLDMLAHEFTTQLRWEFLFLPWPNNR